MSFTEYTIARSQKFSEFEKEVQRHLDEGWMLYGFPFDSAVVDEDSFLCQALTRENSQCDNCGDEVITPEPVELCSKCSPTGKRSVDAVRSLLRLQKTQDCWLDELDERLREFVGDNPVIGNLEMLHLALDLLGLPKENTPDDMSDWQEGVHFCRDYFTDKFRELEIDQFIDLVKQKVSKLNCKTQ